MIQPFYLLNLLVNIFLLSKLAESILSTSRYNLDENFTDPYFIRNERRWLRSTNHIHDKKRTIIDRFLTAEEASTSQRYFQTVHGHMTKVEEGLLIAGQETFHYGMWRNSTSFWDMFTATKLGYTIVQRMHKFVNSLFKVKTTIESIVMNSRLLPGTIYPFNGSEYSHGIHVDNCLYEYFGYRPCTLNKNKNRHYTAIVYINECDGADLIFFDYEEGINDPRDCIANEPTCLNEASACCWGRANKTVIKPTAGKLVVFSSGPENVHGVSKLVRGPRYSLSLWFTRS